MAPIDGTLFDRVASRAERLNHVKHVSKKVKSVAGGPRFTMKTVIPPKNSRLAVFLLCLLTAAVVNSGNMLSIDGERRLQVTHWLWLGEPPVRASEAPVFGNTGKDGRLHAWYGLGHSLWMLPFDAVSHGALAAAGWAMNLPEPLLRQVDSMFVAWMSQSAILFLALLAARELLRRLGFSGWAVSAGSVLFLFGTSLLHYVQNCQENLLLLACDLWAFSCILRWRDEGRPRDAIAAGAAAGFAILTRLTASLDVAALLLFAVMVLRGRLWRFAMQALPAFLLFAFVERFYNYYRFGDWLGTYVPNVRDPSVGAASIFHQPFLTGFLGPFIAPHVSIFLFDPLLAAALLLLAIHWRRVEFTVRAYSIVLVLLLLGQVSLYARFTGYYGPVSWGDRYVAGTVQMLALLAIPLAIQRWAEWRRAARLAVLGITAIAVLIQISSILVVIGVEPMQMRRDGRKVVVVARRWENVALVWTGRAENNPLFEGIPREWTRPAPAPFQLEFRYPRLHKPAVAVWWVLVLFAAIAALKAACPPGCDSIWSARRRFLRLPALRASP